MKLVVLGIEGFDQAHSTRQEIPKQPTVVVPTWVSLTLIKLFMKIMKILKISINIQ